MISEQQVLEGTWEEIAGRHAAELVGKRVRVTVLGDAAIEAGPASMAEFDAFLEAFRADTADLPPPPPDAYSRESLYADHDWVQLRDKARWVQHGQR
jgi:hypothetical protein